MLILALLLAFSSGCGGGGVAQTVAPPLPPADFAITLSSNSLSVPQGATSSPVNISVNAQDGFTGAVQIALSGLPTGVASNPTSPFSVAAGASVPVLFGATSNAGTGSFTITAQGTSGALSHSATFALTIQSSPVAALPRTTYARTDSTSAMNDPPGEAHHRRIAYDPANKHVFVANRAMNRIEVFSTTDQPPIAQLGKRVAQVDVPGASSADLSPDGATLWVGTVTEQVVAIDTASLQVKSRYAIQPLSPVPNESYDRPEELLALSNGNCLMRLRESSGPDALLALWNPGTNSLTTAPSAEQYGFGALARTGDHAKVIIATNDSNSDLAIFDSNGNVLVGPLGLGKGSTPLVAANPDGSRFAVVFVSNGASQLLLLDGSLNRVGAASISVQGLTFSRDGRFLYAAGTAAAFPAIQVFDGQSLQAIGQVPDASIQGIQSEIEDVDETQLIFGIANRGISFVDASNSGTLPSSVPSFASAPVAQPSEGPSVGGTSTSLSGQNFGSTPQAVTFGTQVASNVSLAGATQLQATSPPSASNVAVNVAAYFPGGWLAIAPDAFSYGPQILEVLPNAGTKSGGDSVQIYGYGFGTDASTTTVNIGGASATLQKIENVSSIAPSLGLDSSYPFALERITLQTPPGSPGKANIVVTSAAGTATTSNAFQYLQSPQVYANKALYKFLLYDRNRQFVYLSATDHVDVFDLHAGAFKPGGLPLYCPSRMLAGPCPNADVRGLALTPDGSQLIAADFGSQNVFLLDPDSPGTVSFVPVNVPGYGPARVAATSTQKVFVSLSSVGSASGACGSCLSQLDLTASPPTFQPAPQPEISTLTGSPLLQADAAGDRMFLAFDAVRGGPVALWNATSPNDFTTFSANESPTDVAAAADGTMFAASANGATEIRGTDLTLIGTRATPEIEQVPARTSVPGIAMHPTGALVYQPFLTGPAPAAPSANGLQGGVDILDAHTGRLRLRVFLPEPLAMLSSDIDGLHGEFLAVDENGQRIFALTTSGLTVVQLANVPLGIGTISPAAGPTAGGTALTIRGSGFQAGTAATIGGRKASVTFKDMNTLTVVTPPMIAGPQQLVITNPDGESMTLDAAFTAN